MAKSNEVGELSNIEFEVVAGGFADDNSCCPAWGPSQSLTDLSQPETWWQVDLIR